MCLKKNISRLINNVKISRRLHRYKFVKSVAGQTQCLRQAQTDRVLFSEESYKGLASALMATSALKSPMRVLRKAVR